MKHVDFPGANTVYAAPAGWDASQCEPIVAFVGQIGTGALDGTPTIIVAWQPDVEDLARLICGGALFLHVCGRNLPPHAITTLPPRFLTPKIS